MWKVGHTNQVRTLNQKCFVKATYKPVSSLKSTQMPSVNLHPYELKTLHAYNLTLIKRRIRYHWSVSKVSFQV